MSLTSSSSNTSQNSGSYQYQIYPNTSNFNQSITPLKRARQENWDYPPTMNVLHPFIEDGDDHHHHQVLSQRMISKPNIYDDCNKFLIYESSCACYQPKHLYQVENNKRFKIGSNLELPFEHQEYIPYLNQENLQHDNYRIPVQQHSHLMGPFKQYPTLHFKEINHVLRMKKDHDIQTLPYTESKYSPQYIPDLRHQSHHSPYQYQQLQHQQYNTYLPPDVGVIPPNHIEQEQYPCNQQKRGLETDLSSPSLSPKHSKTFTLDQSIQSKSEARRNASQKRLRDSKGRFTSKIRYVTSKPVPSNSNNVLVSNINN